MVTARFIRDDGQEFLIDNKIWKIPSDGLKGFDGVENEIKTQKHIDGDGVDFISERVGEKDRTIEAILIDRSQNKEMRKKVSNFLLPKHTYKCVLDYNNDIKNIKGRLYSYNLPTENIYNDWLHLTIVLLCDMPYLYKEPRSVFLNSGYNYVDVSGNQNPNFNISVTNSYLTSIGITINDKTLNVNANLGYYDTLKISFKDGKLRVYKNDILSMGLIATNSDLDISLKVGSNTIYSNTNCSLEIEEVYTAL